MEHKKINSQTEKLKKKKLGRGINALIDSDNDFQSSNIIGDELTKKITQIPLDKIVANPHQPRRNFEEKRLEELSVSILNYGVLEPILVSPSNSREEYTIVAGERRFRASQIAKLKEIPAIVLDVEEKERLEIALIENLQREDLNPIEMAFSFKDIMALNKLTQEELANKIGVSRPVISNYVRLLSLPEDIQNSIKLGELSQSHARLLLSIEDPKEQNKLFQNIVSKKLSVQSIEKELKKTKKDSAKQKELLVYENALIQFFGTKVEIKGSINKGKISLEYFNKEDFQRILDLIDLSID